MEHILITGATGFVGKHLCVTLRKQGYQIRRALHKNTNEAMPSDVIIGDIGGNIDWSAALENIDVVIHLAARVHIMKETHPDPMQEFRSTNVDGTAHLARAAAHRGIRLLYISSIKVNGEGHTHINNAYTEQDKPTPTDPYSISKWEAEQAILALHQEHNLEYLIIRPPLIYGPGVGGNFLRLMALISSGIPLPFGRIKNKRSLLYVYNLADFIVRCLQVPSAWGETYLLHDQEDFSTLELAQAIADEMKRPGIMIPFPPSILKLGLSLIGKSSVSKRLCDSLRIDSTKAQHNLDWQAPFTSREAIRTTTRWYCRQHSIK